MQSKHEWRKHEKHLYLPKTKAEQIEIDSFNFISIDGQGHPQNAEFVACVEALYSLAYTIKMGLKKRQDSPPGYTDFTVYPLEGLWDINDEAKKHFDGTVNKNDFVYTLMIRQPDFVSAELFNEFVEIAQNKTHNTALEKIRFDQLREGPCVQMLHIGPYDNEAASFEKMEQFCQEHNLRRLSKRHREIYLSDARKVSADKLKTVLRFQVEKQGL
ncbi:GyrI-like domain-containing protein [Agaribacterium haliotis]|uniref:GyrI-like domain-containing protein n=1 Tax=Agaribacterium haliotis TaxID=2013869 RepID=UPI000BB58157|nr:GyrI-like domain-containing protein [Agaribacterium haliotis]